MSSQSKPQKRRASGWLGLALWAASCSSGAETPHDPLPPLGGQSGGDGTGFANFCACADEETPVAVAELKRLAGGCAELLLLEVWNARPGFAVGDTVGGFLAFACGAAPAAREGDQVFIRGFERGGQDSYACVEYRECSTEQCGDQPLEGSLESWTSCDEECRANTRKACAAHATDAALDGTLSVLPMVGQTAVFDWAGHERRETPAALVTPECYDRQRQQWENRVLVLPTLAKKPMEDEGPVARPPICPVLPEQL